MAHAGPAHRHLLAQAESVSATIIAGIQSGCARIKANGHISMWEVVMDICVKLVSVMMLQENHLRKGGLRCWRREVWCSRYFSGIIGEFLKKMAQGAMVNLSHEIEGFLLILLQAIYTS